jgi:hypothetical protein
VGFLSLLLASFELSALLAKSIVKPKKMSVAYIMQIWYLRCFYGALLVSRSVAIL